MFNTFTNPAAAAAMAQLEQRCAHQALALAAYIHDLGESAVAYHLRFVYPERGMLLSDADLVAWWLVLES